VRVITHSDLESRLSKRIYTHCHGVLIIWAQGLYLLLFCSFFFVKLLWLSQTALQKCSMGLWIHNVNFLLLDRSLVGSQLALHLVYSCIFISHFVSYGPLNGFPKHLSLLLYSLEAPGSSLYSGTYYAEISLGGFPQFRLESNRIVSEINSRIFPTRSFHLSRHFQKPSYLLLEQRFSQLWLWRVLSSGVWRRVVT
jgi:hypothetical protein